MVLPRTLLKAALLLAILWTPAHAFDQGFRASSFPYPFYFKTGDQITLSCWLPSGYQFTHWTHPSGEFVSVTTGRYLVQSIAHTVSLIVTNADITDEGAYHCNARQGAASVSSQVSAYYTEALEIYSTSVNATVDVGGSYNFSCNASNHLMLQWIYHAPGTYARVVSNTSDGRRVITRNNELRLSNIQFEAVGMYECRISNNLGMISLRNNVTVIARPQVIIGDSYEEVTENSRATLSCTVTGVPLPTITWTDRSGHSLETSGEWILSTSNVNSSVVTSNLTFPQVRSSQTGPYTCWGVNKYDNASGTINLRFHDTPEPPLNVMLELVNQTNIRVTWTAPRSSVDSYIIMYRVLNGSSAGDVVPVTVAASKGTSAVLMGLERLTGYSVLVYATNSHGASPNSNQETIATSAEVPDKPLAVVVLDVGPTSLRVEWPPAALPMDDGGSMLVAVRVTALRVESGQLTSDLSVTRNLEDGFVILQGLKDSSSYKVMVEFANNIGYGSGLVSRQYQTPLPGAPGSPIHVSAHNATSDSVLVCWLDSASGQPFLQYKFEVEEAGEPRNKIFRRDADEVTSYPNIPGCSKGIMVDQLESESCYKFRVIAINSVGSGQSSSSSEEVCTTKSECKGGADCLQDCKTGDKNCSPIVGGLTGNTVIIVAAAVPGVLVVLCVGMLMTLVCCALARRAKMRNLEKKGDCIPGINRRGSSNSATKLLTVGRSFSDSFSSSSPNHSPEVSLQPPGTATTLVSNVFEADFAKSNSHEDYLQDTPKFNVSVVHTPSHNPQQMFHITEGHHQGVFQLPQCEEYGKKIAAESTAHHRSTDAPPSYNVCMSATASAGVVSGGHNHVDSGKLVLTDNPNYDDKVLPYMTHGQSSNEHDYHSSGSTPPPVPAYYGGSVSDVQSEAITNHYTDTAFLGESYSQVGYSPAQGRKAEPPQGQWGRTGSSSLPHNKATPYPPQPGATGADASNNVNFVENDAYQTLTEVGGPKFEILGGEDRGAVREMVQFRKQ